MIMTMIMMMIITTMVMTIMMMMMTTTMMMTMSQHFLAIQGSNKSNQISNLKNTNFVGFPPPHHSVRIV
jgi:hypothetical protein